MGQSFVQLPDDAANLGKKLDTQVTAGAAQHREVTVVGDPSVDAAVAAVKNADPTNEYGAIVRDPKTVTLDANLGATADAAVTGDNTGTVSAKLRGLSKILADMWDAGNHWLKVSIQNATLAVTQSGTWTVLFGVATSGGYTNKSFATAATDNATSLKGAAGQLYGVHVFNLAAYPIYVKFYNKATAPAPATDNALLMRRIGVQAGVRADISLPAGLPFSTGIGYAVVKGVGDTDDTSVAANDALVDIEYA